MYKILASLLFLFISYSSAAEETYVFEAKGEFAKELKSLVEKYSKEGKIDAKVYTKKSDEVTETVKEGAMVSYGGDYMKGKELYEKKCSNCHGVKGEESPGYGAKKLTNMPKEDIQEALRNYKNDMQYGGKGKMLMQTTVLSLTEDQANEIISYVHGTKNSQSIDNTQAEEENETPSSYLQ